MLLAGPGPGLLARALSTLGRSRATGHLVVRASGGQRAILRLLAGRVASIESSNDGGRVLGDVLVGEGSIDASACVDDEGRSPDEPIGRFLVRSGRATAGAVHHAVRLQLRARLRALFAWSSHDLTFASEPCDAPHADLPSMPDVLVDALRATVPDASTASLARELGHEDLRLSDFGRELLGGASLRPEEAAVVAMLERGVNATDLALGFATNRRALSFAVALRRIRAAEPTGSAARYSLLLRKHRELRRSTNSAKLLDVGADASPAEARRALRALARDLHPDRFDGANDAAARAISGEVLKALVRAESEVSHREGAAGGRRAK